MSSADQYSMMSGAGYYPYYTASQEEMARMWSTSGDMLSPTGGMPPYGYGAYDYSQMMPGYGYSAFGWYPPGAGWDKNAAMQGYYGMDAYSAGSGGGGMTNGGQDGMGGIEQGMQSLNVGAEEQGNRSAESGDAAPKPSERDRDGLSKSNGVMKPTSSSGPKSWASVASQPSHSYLAKSRSAALGRGPPGSAPGGAGGGGWMGQQSRRPPMMPPPPSAPTGPQSGARTSASTGTLSHQYNPREYDLDTTDARFFVIKSYAEDDIHRSIKYGIWCSTEYGNKRLDAAFREREGKGPIYLFYSVNGSGHFCGVAEMTSPVDYDSSSNVWQQVFF